MAQIEKTLEGLTVHWLTSDRFDTKPDKSSWTEVGHSLASQGATVNIITSFSKEPYQPDGLKVTMIYLKSINLPLIYRVAFTFFAFTWLRRHASRDDLVILNQHELWIMPLLKLARFKRIHLDIRTLPVIGQSLKDKLDVLLFWKLVMKLFAKSCDSHSFITQRLLTAVEQEFSLNFPDHVIWQSGVNADFFTKTLAKAQLTSSGEPPYTLFYHGSLYERRGVNRVVDAFAKLPQVLLNQNQIIGLCCSHERRVTKQTKR